MLGGWFMDGVVGVVVRVVIVGYFWGQGVWEGGPQTCDLCVTFLFF